jgi:hypothetical protein
MSLLLIAIGIAVLVVGKRLAVLGAAVGALLGVALLRWIPGSSGPLIAFGVPIALAVLGFFAAGFAKGIVNIVLIVLGALAGIAITLAFLDLLGIHTGLFDWLLALVGGIIGIVVVMRFKDWAMIVLAGLIGGLLVTRGLSEWLPVLAGIAGTLLVLALAALSVAYQGGLFGKRKA